MVIDSIKKEVPVCKKHKNNAEKNPNNIAVNTLVYSVDDSLINDV